MRLTLAKANVLLGSNEWSYPVGLNLCIMIKKKITTDRNQARNEVRWRPGQEAGSVPPCSNLRYSGCKCSVLQKVLVTLLGLFGVPIVNWRPGNCAPLVTPLTVTLCVATPGCHPKVLALLLPAQTNHCCWERKSQSWLCVCYLLKRRWLFRV